MIEIEFIMDFCCCRKGQRMTATDGFAQIMIEEGKAKIAGKAVDAPTKNKMVTDSVNK